MHANSKVLGLAVVAVLATSVVAASAQAAQFKAAEYPVSFEGNQEGANVFKVETATNMSSTELTCPVARFTGEAVAASETITVHPTYEGVEGTPCKSFGLNATITTTGCDYKVKALTTSTARVDVVCGASPIKVVASTCELTVGSQENVGGTKTLVNNGASPSTVNLNVAVTGIKYTIAKDGIGCPLRQIGSTGAAPLTLEDGTYNGNTLVKGFNEAAEQQSISVE